MMAKTSSEERSLITIVLGGNRSTQRDAVADIAIAFLSQPGHYKIDCARCDYNDYGLYGVVHNSTIDTDTSRSHSMIHIGIDLSSPDAKGILSYEWVRSSYWCLYKTLDDKLGDPLGDIVKGSRMRRLGRARIITQDVGLADLAEQALNEKGYPILKRTGHPEKPDLNNTRLYSLARYIAATARHVAYGLSAWSSANFP